jgi:hypothetical protein
MNAQYESTIYNTPASPSIYFQVRYTTHNASAFVDFATVLYVADIFLLDLQLLIEPDLIAQSWKHGY